MGFINYNIFLTGDCKNTNTGALSLSVTGQSPPFAIIWSNPNSGATFSSQTISTSTYNVTGLSAGSYSFILSDSSIPVNETTPLISFLVTSSSTITLELISNTKCNLNNGEIRAITNIIYGQSTIELYKDGQLYRTIKTKVETTLLQELPPGTYYAKVIDDGGCIGLSNTIFVKESTSLDFGLYVIDSPYCFLGTGKIFVSGVTGTPPYTYKWYNLPTYQSGSSVSNLNAGNYAVTVTDFYGCSTKKVGNVNVASKLSLINVTNTPASCFESDGAISVIVSGGSPPYSYNLSDGSSQIITSNQATFGNLPSGNYTISITDAGLCSISQNIYLVANRAFSVLQLNPIKATCQQLGKILISLQGGFPPYYFSLTNSEGVETRQTSNLSSTAYSNLQPGIYTITITDSFKNCTYTEEVEITSDKNFDLTLSKVDTICGARNGSITANVTPLSTGLTYVYSLSNGTTTTPTTATTYTFTNLYGGFYTVTVTDSENCTDSQSEVIQGSSPYQLALTPTNAFNGSGGTITAMIGNVDTKFNLVWSNNANGQTGIYLTGLTAGTYSVTLSGANGCQQYAQTTVPNIVNSSTTISFVYSSGTSKYSAAKSVSLQTMMYSGYTYVTQDSQNCVLSSATFSLKVTIDTDEYTFPFYSTKSFDRIPTLSYFAPILENAVLSIPYIESCTVNPDNNTVSIKSQIIDGVEYYKDDTITFDILVYFNVRCLSINNVICP